MRHRSLGSTVGCELGPSRLQILSTPLASGSRSSTAVCSATHGLHTKHTACNPGHHLPHGVYNTVSSLAYGRDVNWTAKMGYLHPFSSKPIIGP